MEAIKKSACKRRILARAGLEWMMSCGSGRTLDVGDMQPIRQAVRPGGWTTWHSGRACPSSSSSSLPCSFPSSSRLQQPHHQQACRDGCGAMASTTSSAEAEDAKPASLFTSTTFEKDVSIFVDDEIGAASISPSGRDVVLAR